MQVTADIELQMNSMERIKEYIDKKELEKDWKVPAVPKMNWPDKGVIKVENVFLRY